jgi:hypothetical protein
MEKSFVIMKKDGKNSYNYQNPSDEKMCILGRFLSHDVGCFSKSFIEAATDPDFYGGCSNATFVEKEDGYMILSDIFPAEENLNPAQFKISIPTYIKLLEDWRDKVCKARPDEVTIWYEDDTFTFEVKK